MLVSSRDKNEGTYRTGDEGGGSPRYVTPDLSQNWEGGREYCEDNKWDE